MAKSNNQHWQKHVGVFFLSCGLEKKKPNLLAQGKCRAKNPGAIQANKTNKNKPNHQTKNKTSTSAILLIEIELPEASSFQVAKDGIRSKC